MLLHYSFLLECPDLITIHDLAECGRSDEENCCNRYKLHLLGRWKCHWYVEETLDITRQVLSHHDLLTSVFIHLKPGPQVFISRDAPRYFTAFATHLGCYCLLVVDIILLRWYLTTQNRKRDRLAAEGVREAHDTAFVHAFEDKTDNENPNFRYVY